MESKLQIYIMNGNKNKSYLMLISMLIIFSLMLPRFIIHLLINKIVNFSFTEMSIIIMLFTLFVPLIIILYGLRNIAPLYSLITIFISISILFTIIDSLWLLQYGVSIFDTLFNPTSVITKMIIGLGFGMIAFGSGIYKKNMPSAVMFIIFGVMIYLYAVPNTIPIIYNIITNNSSGISMFME